VREAAAGAPNIELRGRVATPELVSLTQSARACVFAAEEDFGIATVEALACGTPVEMVWWASSKNQAFGGPLWDWISPSGVRKLITAGTVMPPEQRDCIVPAEVIKASGEGLMVSLQAYGPQADFAYPPRPADTKKPWNPEWIARVRFRSSTMLIPGMEGMEGMSSSNAQSGEQAKPAKPKCKGLKGLAERAAGLCE
jgi:hypothetical protein